MFKKSILNLVVSILVLSFTGCPMAQETAEKSYTVTYKGNNSTGGEVPVDEKKYYTGDLATILSPGSLKQDGYIFKSWNTALDGSGDSYLVGDKITVTNSDIVLYAIWSELVYSVTYNGNGNSSGTVPVDITVYKNGDQVTILSASSLIKDGYNFTSWNSASDGSGDSYLVGDKITVTNSDIVLYAIWNELVYSVTYNGNGNSSGTVPVDSSVYKDGDQATILSGSSLIKDGYNFTSWNSKSDNSGTSYSTGEKVTIKSSNITLYAIWTEVIPYASNYLNNTFDVDSSITYSNNENSTSITGSFTLPVTAVEDGENVTIVWSEVSDSGNNISIGTDGVVSVIQSATNKDVTIKATATADGTTVSRNFTVTIQLTTKGSIQGTTSYGLDTDGNYYTYEETGATKGVGIALTTDLVATTIPSAKTSSDSNGFYSLKAEAGNYYIWHQYDQNSGDPIGVTVPNWHYYSYATSPELDSLGLLVDSSHGNNFMDEGHTVAFSSDGTTQEYHARSTGTLEVRAAETLTINFTLEGY